MIRKNIFIELIIVLILLFFWGLFNASAQISKGGIPPSFSNLLLQKSNYAIKKLPPPDLIKISAEDKIIESQGVNRRPRMAVSLYTDFYG